MSEEPVQDGAAEDGGEVDAGPAIDPVETLRKDWRSLWQTPALLATGGVLMLGLAYTISTKPDPVIKPALKQSDALLKAELYTEAIELLNTKVYPWVADPEGATNEERIRYHLNKARAIDRGQRAAGFEDDRNHVSIIREYLEAERLGALLEAADIAALSRVYLSRGEMDTAKIRASQIPDTRRDLRDDLNHKIVENLLDRPVPKIEPAMEMLNLMLTDSELAMDRRVWAMERQARIQLEKGFVDETITRILREMPRLERAQADGRSRLHLLLGRGYLMLGANDHARKQIEHAYDQSGAGDPHYSEILLAHAQLEDTEGNTYEARDLYAQITENYSRDRVYPWALVGLGETQAAVSESELSIDAYETLVSNYDSLGIESEPSRNQVLDSILARASDTLAAGVPEDSLRYTTLGERLFKIDDLPPEIFEMLMNGHKAMAEKLLGSSLEETRSLLSLDPSTRAQVQRHLIAAATNAQMHAERFIVSNLPKHASSLWISADLFDRAGDQHEAIIAFQTYANSMPSDPRYAEALFRLGQSLRAVGDFQKSAEIFEQLIQDREGVLGADIGPFADASFVPLAQAYLYDEDEENDTKAEQLLLTVLSGTKVSTETELYRTALLEMAGHYDSTGRAARAIERYEEFVARYEGDPETAVVIFRLAEAHRRMGDKIELSMGDSMPAAERNERASKMRAHRTRAIEHYESAIRALGALKLGRMGMFESIALRNAYFYMGDCAFDLNDYDEAIRYYDIARDRYSDDPASLVAMVQIVNSYIAKDEIGRAATANERARRFYSTIPDDVWDDPNLPMDRGDWERWLDSSAMLLSGVIEP
ncbi:MAG: tetratricopeptide repeat protein [Phycisphaerales bacterium]|nr:tetratricopeptide repeat protein [Phycisphaerales bacterium]